MISRFLSKILLTVNIIFALLLVLAYGAARINPINVPFLAIFGLFYPYGVLINLIFTIFWIIFRKWYALISFLVLAIGISSFNNHFRFFSQNTDACEDSFKVMSYNVRVFGAYADKNNKQIRDNIFGFVRDENPDILNFQEFYEGKKIGFAIQDSLKKHQDFKYKHVYFSYFTRKQKFGIATYSKYPIVNKEVIEFPNTTNSCIISDIKINKDTVRIFNCHLESLRFTQADYNFIDSLTKPRRDIKIQQAQNIYTRLKKAYQKRAVQLNLITEAIKKTPYPVLLCGDFNDPPSSYTYHFLSKYLQDSFVEQGVGKGVTFYRGLISYRIDYILHTKGINCCTFNVPKVEYSDHYPIIGEYSIK